jgi:hypothetical protein
MGVLDRFEKGIERAINGAFAKAFRSEVQPVEIASALRRELDERSKIVSRGRTLAPNVFVVELGASDHERLQEWQEALSGELAQVVQEYAAQQRFGFVGPVRVSFEEAEDLDTGLFRVRSSTASTAPAGRAPDLLPRGPAAPPAEEYRAPQGQAPHPAYAPTVPHAAAAAARPAATLDVDGRVYRLDQAVTVMGRSPDVDIVLDDPGVSRRHAEVHFVDGRARVVDLGSTNGTFVDGERVHAGSLTDGSTITVGRSRIVYRAGAH